MISQTLLISKVDHDYLIAYFILHVKSNIESWEWPGDKAINTYLLNINIHVFWLFLGYCVFKVGILNWYSCYNYIG